MIEFRWLQGEISGLPYRKLQYRLLFGPTLIGSGDIVLYVLKPEQLEWLDVPTVLDEATKASQGDEEAEDNGLYAAAVAIVKESGKASISRVQRNLKLGYNQSARLLERMEAEGIIGPLQPNGSREVLK